VAKQGPDVDVGDHGADERELARLEWPDRRHMWVRAALDSATDGPTRPGECAVTEPHWTGRHGWAAG
jgi:hypothetical protein